MSNTPNAEELAAIPTARAIIAAVKAFDANMGNDPLQWVAKYPGSKLILVGTVVNLVPSLAAAEGGALMTTVGNLLDGWDAALAKIQAGAPAAPAA
jgi:hypothetical protein